MEFRTPTLRFHHACDQHPSAEGFCRHAHPQYEILFFTSGNARCVIEHREYHLTKGDVVLIPPLHYHFIKIDGPSPYERTVLNFNHCDVSEKVLNTVFTAPRVVNCLDDAHLPALFSRLDTLLAAFDGDDAVRIANCLLTELIYLLSQTSGTDERFTVYHNETLRNALRYVEDHLTTIRTADEIADALFISRSQLYQCFKEAFGIPPMKYILEKRLVLAQSRLQLGEKSTIVAAVCGFNEYSSFYRNYKKRFGHPPKST